MKKSDMICPAKRTFRSRSGLVASAIITLFGFTAAPSAAMAWPSNYPGAMVSGHVNTEPTLLQEDWIELKFDRNNGDDVAANNQFPNFDPQTNDIAGFPCEHVQKTLRLPQRTGYGNKTYFVGTSSQDNGGWIYLIESYPGVFGADGEGTVPDESKYVGGFAGKVVWYKRTNGSDFANYGGGCNHPGNMTVHPNGTLALACQNWDVNSHGCKLDLVEKNSVPVNDTAVFFSVVNAHTSARLEYLGHWDVPASFGVPNHEFKVVGLAQSGNFTHVWVGGDSYRRHYRAPLNFTPVTSPAFSPHTDLTELTFEGSSGNFTSGNVDPVYVGSGSGRLMLADIKSVKTKDCLGVDIFGNCAGSNVVDKILNQASLNEPEYLDSSGNASTTMQISTTTVRLKSDGTIKTNFFRGNHHEFNLCQDSLFQYVSLFASDCPTAHYWCAATAGYYASTSGQGALYCFDTDTYSESGTGLKMRSYAYDTRVVVDTGTGSGDGTDSFIEAKLEFTNGSFDWIRLDNWHINDFTRGSHRAYAVPQGLLPFDVAAFDNLKLRNRGGDRFYPAAVKVERNGATLLSWTNGNPEFRLDNDCGTAVGSGCAKSFQLNAAGAPETLTDYVGVRTVTHTSSGAGANAPIYYAFKTQNNSWSDWFLLDNTKLNDFSAGATDTFEIDVGQPLSGPIEAIKIKNTGNDEWRPALIAVDSAYHPGQPYWNETFTWTEADGNVRIAGDCDNVIDSVDKCSPTFVLLPGNTHSISDWEIWTHTRNVSGAGTDAQVTFQVDFSTGKFSDVAVLDDPADNMEANRWDAMPITGLTEAEDEAMPLKVRFFNPGTDGWQPDEVLIKHYGVTVWQWTRPSAFANVWVDKDATTPTSPTDGMAQAIVLIDNGGSNQDAIDSTTDLVHDTWVQLQTSSSTNAGTNTEIILSAQFESGFVSKPLLIVDETPANLELGTTQNYYLGLPTDQGKITKILAEARGNDGWIPQSITVYSKGPGTLFSWSSSQTVWIDGDATTSDVFLDDQAAAAGVFLNQSLTTSTSTNCLDEASTFGYDEYTIETHTASETNAQTNTPVYFKVKFASGDTLENGIASSLEGVLEQGVTNVFGIHHIPMSNSPGAISKVMFRAGSTDGWSPDSIVIKRYGTPVWEWTRPSTYATVFVDGDATTSTIATDDGQASQVVFIDNGGTNEDSIANAVTW